jgi:transposase
MKTLLAGAQILKLEKIVQMSGAITLFASSAQAIVICPSCQTLTSKVHSRYERAAADLQWEGIPVRLRLQVRKFFCLNSECHRRIFCERLPEVVARYAHRTDRLNEAFSSIGFALWLLLKKGEKLTEEERLVRQTVIDASPVIGQGFELVESFREAIVGRSEDKLDASMDAATKSQIPEFENFVMVLRRDEAAVRAAASSEWSNGQTEGQVNRLKMLKRQMYGRANFDLLRARVLNAP